MLEPACCCLSSTDHMRCNVSIDIPDSCYSRTDELKSAFSPGKAFGQPKHRRDNHAASDGRRATQDGAEGQTWKDVRVVSLSWFPLACTKRSTLEMGNRRKDDTSATCSECFRGCTLRESRRDREWEGDKTWGPRSHMTNNGFCGTTFDSRKAQ